MGRKPKTIHDLRDEINQIADTSARTVLTQALADLERRRANKSKRLTGKRVFFMPDDEVDGSFILELKNIALSHCKVGGAGDIYATVLGVFSMKESGKSTTTQVIAITDSWQEPTEIPKVEVSKLYIPREDEF